MEKYKYCNIEPTSSPRVEGEEERKAGGARDIWGYGCTGRRGDARKGDVFLLFFCFFAGYGDAAFEKTESETRVYVYMYMYIIIIFFTYNIYISLYRFFLLFCLRFIFLPLFLSLSFSHSRSFSLSLTHSFSRSHFFSLLFFSFYPSRDDRMPTSATEKHQDARRCLLSFLIFSPFFIFLLG